MEFKHALITGGSSGIGRALALKLAASGHNVSMIARREELLKATAAEVASRFAQAGQRVFTQAADVADGAQAEASVEASIRELGAPDLVIVSAGIVVPGHFADIPREAFERSMAVNYFGSLYVVRAALPAMRARQRGRIVFISSGAGLLGFFGYSTYSPTKFALRGLAETLRAELRADKIGVSIAYPPDTDTPMLTEENKTKPEETKLITGSVKTWSADAVADCILKGVAKGAFGIAPGATLTMMNRFPGLVNPIVTLYADWMADSARKKRAKR